MNLIKAKSQFNESLVIIDLLQIIMLKDILNILLSSKKLAQKYFGYLDKVINLMNTNIKIWF